MKRIRSIRSNLLWSSILLTLDVLFYVYTYYYYESLSAIYSSFAVDKVIELLTIVPSLMAATIGTLITAQFSRGERLFRIWLVFTAGWWFWAIGELLYLPFDILYPEGYPDFSLVDVCWLAGYFLFGLALYYQLQLVYGSKKRSTVFYLIFIAVIGLATYFLTEAVVTYGLGGDSAWWVLYLSILYPVMDIFEGGAAIWLSVLYGRGVFGRVWWALIAFTVADAITIFFWLGGGEWLSGTVYLWLDIISTVTYGAGYAIAAIAMLVSYNLLRFGLPRR